MSLPAEVTSPFQGGKRSCDDWPGSGKSPSQVTRRRGGKGKSGPAFISLKFLYSRELPRNHAFSIPRFGVA
jgi:hypothetical protein